MKSLLGNIVYTFWFHICCWLILLRAYWILLSVFISNKHKHKRSMVKLDVQCLLLTTTTWSYAFVGFFVSIFFLKILREKIYLMFIYRNSLHVLILASKFSLILIFLKIVLLLKKMFWNYFHAFITPLVKV